jgi:DNA-binding cell septation regulator SpoVG
MSTTNYTTIFQGEAPMFRVYTHVFDTESDVLSVMRLPTRMAVGDLQSGDGWSAFAGVGNLLYLADKALGKMFTPEQLAALGANFLDYLNEMIENISYLVGALNSAHDMNDVFRALYAVTRFFSKKSFGKTFEDLMLYFASLSEVQSFDFADIRAMLDNYASMKTSPLVMKVQKLCAVALSSCFMQAAGISAKIEEVILVYSEGLKAIASDTDFVVTLVDLVTFMIERLAQCWYLKSLQPFFHSSRSYGKWANEAHDIITRSQLLHNPEANGFTYHGFLEDLEKCIEEGGEIRKFSQAADMKDVVGNVLSKLRVIRGEVLTRKAAGEERRAPFSILVHGGSSVGKSSFVRTFLGHFGKMFNLPEGPEFVFTRCFSDQYWSNFKTQMWGMFLDDIASVNPNKGSEDISLNELLQIVNNVPYCPPQADIADKGKTPLRVECVVATTNTVHLNADFWFSNPVAVRRRFPFVVKIHPKTIYSRDDAREMIDPSKIPLPEAGCYDDLWDIVLYKTIVVRADDNGNQGTELKQVAEFDNIYKFYAHMSVLIRDFRSQQVRAASNDENMRTVTLCASCDLPSKHCTCEVLQSSEVSIDITQEPSFSWSSSFRLAAVAGTTFGAAAAASHSEQISQMCATTVTTLRTSAASTFRTYTREFLVSYMKELGGSLMQKFYENKALRYTLCAIATLGSCYGAYKLFEKLGTQETTQTPVAQGHVISSVGAQPPSTGDERENVYHQKNDVRAALIVSDQTKSWKSLEWTAVCAKFANSVVAIQCSRKVGDKMVIREGIAVCVGGRLYVTDNHNIPDTECVMTVTREMHTSGLSTNVTRVFDPRVALRMPEKELVFFQLLDSFDCKDITPFLSSPSFTTVSKGSVISREQNGGVKIFHSAKVVNLGRQKVPALDDIELNLWEYKLDAPTYVGLCGALVAVNAPVGPVIVGLHLLGKDNVGSCASLTLNDVENARKHFFPIFSPAPIMLESKDRTVGVTTLHNKSVFRYVERGNGRTMGQLTMPRAQPKTNVQATIFRDEAIKYGFKVETGAPIMKGWRPWHHTLDQIVHQSMLFKESVIMECAEAYLDEVYHGLSESDRKEIAQMLDLPTALNGIPGRKYIDSVNRSSSAGFPWMTTKKKVTFGLPADSTWQDPIDVSDEVKERMSEMWNRYQNYELAAPLFTAHLKDEPLVFRKIEAGKTRVMNGAPFDWSLIVRMLYLPLVRVIQNNKFLFEAMPGAVAQSREWDDIYHEVTTFGEDRMFAGDYGKFDKRMGAVLIMWGFKILISLAERCGSNEEHIRAMWGVAYDISCSWCNFNCDLVQFLGSNPSGHPLTVILNCIVNSLYMRYCYRELNPDKEVRSFRDNVKLVTYGDDNLVGSRVDWFNHTSVAKMLGELGVEYTMADKEAESVPFLNIRETSFLKRGWRYEPDLNAVVCPIDHSTLDKMMTTWIPSSEIGPYAHGEEIIRNVGVEYFWYGREIFESKQKVLKEIFAATIPEEYATARTFPTWEYLINMWRVSSNEVLHAVGAPAE